VKIAQLAVTREFWGSSPQIHHLGKKNTAAIGPWQPLAVIMLVAPGAMDDVQAINTLTAVAVFA